MSKRFNPLQLWLSIDIPLGEPSHYELLAISPAERDIGKIESAARNQLATLNSVEPGEHHSELESLKKRVKEAFAVISSPATRAQYDRELSARPQPVQRASKSDMLPPGKKTEPSTSMRLNPGSESSSTKHKAVFRKNQVDPDLLPPSKILPSDLLPPGAEVPPKADGPADQFDPPKAKRVAVDLYPPEGSESIPVAKAVSVPPTKLPVAVVRKSVSHESSIPTAKLAESLPIPTDPVRSESEASVSSQVDAGVAEGNDPILVSGEGQKNGSRGLLITALAVLFAALVLGGTIYGLGFLKSPGALAGKLEELEDRNATTVVPQNEPKEQTKAASKDRSESEVDSNVPEGESPGDEGSRGNPPSKEPTSEIVTDVVDDPDNDDVERTSDVEPESLEKTRPEIHEVLAQLQGFNLASQRRLKYQMFGVKNLWLKQDWERLAEVSQAADLDGNQIGLKEFDVAVEQTSQRLKEFWQQFETSCRENQGDIEIDGRVVGFVEAAPTHLTLKIAGTNRRYDYRFVPPGLIVEIIDRNVIPDIPTYRLQKAAYLTAQLYRKPSLVDDIEELLMLSENDGHDVYYLRLMSQLSFWDLAKPSDKVSFTPEKNAFKKLAAHQGLDSINSFEPVDARSVAAYLWYQAADVDAQNVFVDESELETPESKRRLEVLSVARDLAIRGSDTLAAMDIARIMGTHWDVKASELYYETLLRLGEDFQGDRDDANWYCDAVLGFLREYEQELNRRSSNRLGVPAVKLAEKFDLNAFAIQLEAKLNSFR